MKNFKQKIYCSKQWATIVQSVSWSILLFDSQAIQQLLIWPQKTSNRWNKIYTELTTPLEGLKLLIFRLLGCLGVSYCTWKRDRVVTLIQIASIRNAMVIPVVVKYSVWCEANPTRVFGGKSIWMSLLGQAKWLTLPDLCLWGYWYLPWGVCKYNY